jgi:hypothetical protein
VYSTVPFNEFSNFHVIDKPTIIKNIEGGAMLSPFLFHDEYDNLDQYNHLPYWAGHFEFKDFKITGYNIKMEHGPDSTRFNGPKHILSGHFHMRQQQRNVIFVGNCFPMDFGDAGDNDRGMAIYDHIKHKPSFINWKECPKYIKVKLSDLLDDDAMTFDKDARVHCTVDIPLSHSESTDLKKKFAEDFGLREFTTEESYGLDEALTDTAVADDSSDDKHSLDEMVVNMLGGIEVDGIDNTILQKIYMEIKVDD